MLMLNTLFQNEGLDPKEVKLVRHKDTRFPDCTTPYALWMAEDPDFEVYQRLQGKPKFNGASYIASFVVTPLAETLFVGVYAIGGYRRAPRDLVCPVAGTKGERILYDLAPTELLADYRGRLVVDWGEGYRSWIQRAHRKDKPVIELRRTVGDPPFPGLLEFRTKLSQLLQVPPTWRSVLESVSGVYVLTHPENGRLYVGSACGERGFWGRWEQYVSDGHGGNLMLKEIGEADYHVTILEVAASSASVDEIIGLENRWKEKLLSRIHGLNKN